MTVCTYIPPFFLHLNRKKCSITTGSVLADFHQLSTQGDLLTAVNVLSCNKAAHTCQQQATHVYARHVMSKCQPWIMVAIFYDYTLYNDQKNKKYEECSLLSPKSTIKVIKLLCLCFSLPVWLCFSALMAEPFDEQSRHLVQGLTLMVSWTSLMVKVLGQCHPVPHYFPDSTD